MSFSVKNNKIVVCRMPVSAQLEILAKHGKKFYEYNTFVFSREDINPYICDVINLDTPMREISEIYELSRTGFGANKRHYPDNIFVYHAFFEATIEDKYLRADTHLPMTLA